MMLETDPGEKLSALPSLEGLWCDIVGFDPHAEREKQINIAKSADTVIEFHVPIPHTEILKILDFLKHKFGRTISTASSEFRSCLIGLYKSFRDEKVDENQEIQSLLKTTRINGMLERISTYFSFPYDFIHISAELDNYTESEKCKSLILDYLRNQTISQRLKSVLMLGISGDHEDLVIYIDSLQSNLENKKKIPVNITRLLQHPELFKLTGGGFLSAWNALENAYNQCPEQDSNTRLLATGFEFFTYPSGNSFFDKIYRSAFIPGYDPETTKGVTFIPYVLSYFKRDPATNKVRGYDVIGRSSRPISIYHHNVNRSPDQLIDDIINTIRHEVGHECWSQLKSKQKEIASTIEDLIFEEVMSGKDLYSTLISSYPSLIMEEYRDAMKRFFDLSRSTDTSSREHYSMLLDMHRHSRDSKVIRPDHFFSETFAELNKLRFDPLAREIIRTSLPNHYAVIRLMELNLFTEVPTVHPLTEKTHPHGASSVVVT